MKRLGDLKVQVDRWPTSENPMHPYLLSVVIVGMYRSRPDQDTIVRAIEDAAEIINQGERESGAA
jgi:hypothetical protein